MNRLRVVHRNVRGEDFNRQLADTSVELLDLASDLHVMQGTVGWKRFEQIHRERLLAMTANLIRERDHREIIRLQAGLAELEQILQYVPAVIAEAARVQGELEELDVE